MFFIRTLVLLSAIVSSVAEGRAACEEVKITRQNLIQTGTPGWTVVRVILLYDWTARQPGLKPTVYPLVVEMPSPSRARADLDLWIKQIYACSEIVRAGNVTTKKEAVQYTVEARREKLSRGDTTWVWLETPLLLPTNVVAQRARAKALIAGVAFPGRWANYRGELVLILEPQQKQKEGSD